PGEGGGGAGGAPAGGRLRAEQRPPDGLSALPGERVADRVGSHRGGVQGGGGAEAEGERDEVVGGGGGRGLPPAGVVQERRGGVGGVLGGDGVNTSSPV